MSDQLHTSVETLLKDITTPTEPRSIQEPPAPPAPPDPPPPPDPPAAQEQRKAVAPDPEPAQERPEISPEILANSADLVIGLFDFSQHNIFRALGNRRKKRKMARYGPDAASKLESLLNEVDAYNTAAPGTAQMVRTLGPEDIGLLRIEKAAQEYLDGLPLTDYEKEAIKVPLMEIMKKRGGTIPPEIALLLAVMQISAARTTELFLL